MHYGWIICIGCFILNFCALGMCTSTISVYYPYLRDNMGISNTAVSLIPTIRALFSMISIFAAGAYYKKTGLRIGACASCFLLAVGWLLLGVSGTVVLCYVSAAIMGIAYSLGSVYPIAIFMRNWFEQKRATAMAVSFCGSSLCAFALPPVITQIIESRGVAGAAMITMAFCMICTAILYLLLREKPADLGMEPYGFGENNAESSVNKTKTKEVHLSKTEKILLIGAFLIMGLVAAPSTAHYSIHFQTVGYSAAVAALGISIYGVALAVGKIAFGAAKERIGTYRVNYLFLGAWVAASLATAFVHGSVIWVIVASFLNGIGLTNGSIAVTLWCGELAARADYEKSVQQGQMANAVGAFVGTPFPGIVADLTGSYLPIYVIYAVMLVGMAVIVQGLYRKHVVRPVQSV